MVSKFFLPVILVAFVAYAKAQNIPSEHPFGNIALNKPIWADSQEEPVLAAVDGSHTSYWQSGNSVGNHWMQLKLGKRYIIDQILLQRLAGVDSLVIEAGNDGNWQVVFQGKPHPENPLLGFKPFAADQLRLRSIQGKQMVLHEIEVYPYNPQPVMVNQSGYDIAKHKHFTAPLAPDATRFTITRPQGSDILYEGRTQNKIGDFTAFHPADSGPFIIQLHGKNDLGTSVPFNIGTNWIEKVSYAPAINFMVDTRCWFGNAANYNPTDKSSDCPDLGVGWRDSHQFSFEIPSLLQLYFANPAAFTTDRMPVQGNYQGLREKLPEQTPEIVRLIYWAVDIYLRGKVNHTLLKEQLAYFVYAYPWLSEYIPAKVYEEARDYIFAIWEQEEINRWQWHDIAHTGNLLQTYKVIGTGKGQLPPGHSIIPNLMMYEVAMREKRPNPEQYFRAAFLQTDWLLKNLDWNDPATTKGQRQGEHVAIPSFVYFLKNYPNQAPKGLAKKIEDWAQVALQRSDNMWEYRRYSDKRWTIPSIRPVTNTRYDPASGFNEPGNIAGFPASGLAAAMVLKDSSLQNAMRRLAVSHTDHVFGRNPAGRHFCFDAARDFEGVELGWFKEYEGGAGKLQTVRGVLDGSPKEPIYPYNPGAGDPGHTEGWVTFNTAWNIGLAYLAADATTVRVYDPAFIKPIKTAKPGSIIGIELDAPLNFNYNLAESATVEVTIQDKNYKVPVQEVAASSTRFRGSFTLPPSAENKELKVTYGMGWHQKSDAIRVK